MDFPFEASQSLKRLQPRLAAVWQESGVDELTARRFESRLAETWEHLFTLLYHLYGGRYDFFYHLEQILLTAARSFIDRPEQLREIDAHHVNEPDWFQSQELVGGALYVDLFSENLGKLREHIPYFKDLGLTYLHLMPLFAVRPGDNDGGYAITNYRSIDPRIGTIEDLRAWPTICAKRELCSCSISSLTTPPTTMIGRNGRRQAIASFKSITTSSPIARSPTSTNGRCARSSPRCGAAISPGTTAWNAGSGRPSTAFNGI